MKIKYSKEKFEGFTHRFKVQFETGREYHSNIDIFSNSDNREKLEEFINDKKSKEVISFKIVNIASKEQDEMAEKFINETLINI